MATGEPHLEMRPLLCIFNSQLGLGCITQTNKFEVLKCLFIFWHFDKISIYQSAKHINLLLWMCNGLNNPSIKKYQPLPEVKYLNERPVSIFSVREQPPSKALNQNKLLSVSQIPVGATKKERANHMSDWRCDLHFSFPPSRTMHRPTWAVAPLTRLCVKWCENRLNHLGQGVSGKSSPLHTETGETPRGHRRRRMYEEGERRRRAG